MLIRMVVSQLMVPVVRKIKYIFKKGNEVKNISGVCGLNFFVTFMVIVIFSLFLLFYVEIIRFHVLKKSMFSPPDLDFRNSNAFRRLKFEISIYSLLIILLYPSADLLHDVFKYLSYEVIYFVLSSLAVYFVLIKRTKLILFKILYLINILIAGGVLGLRCYCPEIAFDVVAIFVLIWSFSFRVIEVESQWLTKVS